MHTYVPNEQKETFGPPPPRRKKPRMPAHVLAESRVAGPPAEKGASKAPSTTLVRQGARGFLHEIRCTRRNSGTLRVRPVPNPTPPPAPPFHQRKSGIEREEKKKTGASGVNRHSDKHAPRSIPEAQDAFKVLMIHWILQVARRIAFRCVLHRCGSQDIRR